MNGLLALLVLATNPMPDVQLDEVSVIEWNAYHDAQGRLVFDQIIYYDGPDPWGYYSVRAWRLLKSDWQIPNRQGVAVWLDGDTMRRVTCKAFVRSWTTHDPELVARERLPKEKRRELVPVKMAIVR